MPSTERRRILQLSALVASAAVGIGVLSSGISSDETTPSWGPPVEGAGDWAIIEEDVDRFTAEDGEGALTLTVQGPNDGADRFRDGTGLRIVSYDASVADFNREWNYRFGRPELRVRLTGPRTDGEVIYFSNTNAFGDTPAEGSVPGREEIRHKFSAGGGRGAVNPQLNYSPAPDSEGSEVEVTMESEIRAPVSKIWQRETDGRTRTGTLECRITEEVTFVR